MMDVGDVDANVDLVTVLGKGDLQSLGERLLRKATGAAIDFHE